MARQVVIDQQQVFPDWDFAATKPGAPKCRKAVVAPSWLSLGIFNIRLPASKSEIMGVVNAGTFAIGTNGLRFYETMSPKQMVKPVLIISKKINIFY